MCLMSMALALVFPVAVKCCPGFPSCNTSQSAWDELCGKGSTGMSMSSGCFGCMVLSVSLWDV